MVSGNSAQDADPVGRLLTARFPSHPRQPLDLGAGGASLALMHGVTYEPPSVGPEAYAHKQKVPRPSANWNGAGASPIWRFRTMNKTTDTETATMWVLSSGSYSDYQVHCIVRGGKREAELLAKRASADRSYDSYDVQEMPVVSSDVERVEILKLIAEVRDAGPSVTDERIDVRVEWPFDALYGAPEMEWRWVRAPIHNGRGGRLEVWGTDHERVRKVYSDRKAMLLTDDAMRAKREASGRR